MKRLFLASLAAAALALAASPGLADHHEKTEANPCNPCAAKKANPCNPCSAKNPCNPCSAKNPCAAKNPCGAKGEHDHE